MKQTTEAVVEIADRAMEAAEDAMQKCRAAAGKLLGQTICAIMEQEIMLQLRERRMADAHYANARNGYKRKTLTSNFGSIQTRVPQDRSSDYEPILIGKYRKDVRDIEGAIFRLYAGGKAARLTAAKALYDQFRPEAVVVTCGKRGGVLYNGSAVWYPIYPATVVDSNGAGDVFHGAFAAGVVMGFDPEKCCHFSTAVSGLKCTGVGARESVPDFETVKQYMKENGYEL